MATDTPQVVPPDQAALANPPVAPQPTPQFNPEDAVTGVAGDYLKGLRARFVDPAVNSIKKIASRPAVAPVVAAADAAVGGPIIRAAAATPQGQSVVKAISDFAKNPILSVAEQAKNTMMGGELGPEGGVLEDAAGELLQGLRTRKAPEAVPSTQAPEAKIYTDNSGIKWAENADGIRVSIPGRISDAEVQEYAAKKLTEQADMQAAIKKGNTPAAETKPAVKVPPEQTTGVHDAAIRKGGGVPGGIQKGDSEYNEPDLIQFHDPKTGSTLGLPIDEVTPEKIASELKKSRDAFAAGDLRKQVRDAAKPDLVYRARPQGEEGISSASHAQATASETEAHQYRQNLEDMAGSKPHEVVPIDLNKVAKDQYTRMKGPNGEDWVKFHKDQPESVVHKPSAKQTMKQTASSTDNMNDPDTRYGAAQHEAGHAVISEMLNPGSVQNMELGDFGGKTVATAPDGKQTPKDLNTDELTNMVARSLAGGEFEPGGTTTTHSSGDVANRAKLMSANAGGLAQDASRIVTGKASGNDPMLAAPNIQAQAQARLNALMADPRTRQAVEGLASKLADKGKMSGDEIRAHLKSIKMSK